MPAGSWQSSYFRRCRMSLGKALPDGCREEGPFSLCLMAVRHVDLTLPPVACPSHSD